MPKTSSNNPIFWDYDLNKADFSDPKVKIWYLNRKLQFGDFSGITKKDLRKYLPSLDIDASLKELLQNYLKSYAWYKAFASPKRCFKLFWERLFWQKFLLDRRNPALLSLFSSPPLCWPGFFFWWLIWRRTISGIRQSAQKRSWRSKNCFNAAA